MRNFAARDRPWHLYAFLCTRSRAVALCSADPSPDDQPENLFENIMACANNCHQLYMYVNPLILKLSEKCGEKNQVYIQAEEDCLRCRDKFEAAGDVAGDNIVLIITADLREHFGQLFTTKWLRSRVAIKTIAATVRDYAGDLELEESVREEVLMKLARKIVASYLQSLFETKLPAKREDREVLVKLIEEEREEIVACFADVDSNCEDVAAVLENVVHIMQSPPSLLVAEWRNLRSKYRGIGFGHLELMLSLRDDMNSKEEKRMVHEIFKKCEEDEVDDSEVPTEDSVFGLIAEPPTKYLE